MRNYHLRVHNFGFRVARHLVDLLLPAIVKTTFPLTGSTGIFGCGLLTMQRMKLAKGVVFL